MWPRGRFVVAGPQYPPGIRWPANVERIVHLSPDKHRGFYNAQRFTLNITRAAMVQAGFSPSVRLFEAAACGTPIISDPWPGLETIFKPATEILVVTSAAEVLEIVCDLPEQMAEEIGSAARKQVMAHHTSEHRAAELEAFIIASRNQRRSRRSNSKVLQEALP